MKDLRDPAILGERLISYTATVRGAYGSDIPMSEVFDVHVQHLANPDYASDLGPVEKYGDPVKTHRARIALGMEVELP